MAKYLFRIREFQIGKEKINVAIKLKNKSKLLIIRSPCIIEKIFINIIIIRSSIPL